MDRLDIDALLISSVYGELSSADETRLRAHLESHPADRTLLDRLTRARAAVQESRVFAMQLDPPAAVSALLLQEAARRVPRQVSEDEPRGWFAWLRRSIFMHPAMAAALMLVIVVGVAGTLYFRRGERGAPEVAGGEYASAEPRGESAPPPAATAAPATAAGSAAPATAAPEADRSEYYLERGPGKETAPRAGNESYRVGLANEGAATSGKKAESAKSVTPPTRRLPSPSTILEVTGTDRKAAPKDIDDAEAGVSAPPPKPSTRGAQPNAAEPQVPEEPDAIARRDSDADKRLRVAPNATTDSRPAAGQGGGKGAPEAAEPAIAMPEDAAWARDQHARLVKQVSAGKCADAAGTAAELSGRAPSYYKQNVATDRAVKDCLAYINVERERAAERKAAKQAKPKPTNAPSGKAKAAPVDAAPPPSKP